MAVTPVGNPYVESSDLVANYPGASEALAERIDIVGVNPFADSAARATAIPSPVEGQMASLNDDDKVYRYSGSAWVAVGLPPGLNPVAPTSIANSGGSASTTGNTTTFATVTALSLNGIFTTTYKNYQVVLSCKSAADVGIRLRYRAAGTDVTTTTYFYQNLNGVSGSASANLSNQAFIDLGATKTTEGIREMIFSYPAAAQATGHTRYGGQYGEVQVGAAHESSATAYDGFTIFTTASNFSGIISVYGYTS